MICLASITRPLTLAAKATASRCCVFMVDDSWEGEGEQTRGLGDANVAGLKGCFSKYNQLFPHHPKTAAWTYEPKNLFSQAFGKSNSCCIDFNIN